MRKVERQLRARLKNAESLLEETRRELEEDREKFRTHFSERFRWWIKLVGEGKSTSAAWLIEADAKFLTTVQRWFW